MKNMRTCWSCSDLFYKKYKDNPRCWDMKNQLKKLNNLDNVNVKNVQQF